MVVPMISHNQKSYVVFHFNHTDLKVECAIGDTFDLMNGSIDSAIGIR